MLKYRNEKKKVTNPMNRQSYEEGSNDSSPQLLLVNFNPLLYIYYFLPLDLSKEEEEEIKFIVTKSGHNSKKNITFKRKLSSSIIHRHQNWVILPIVVNYSLAHDLTWMRG